MKAWVAQRMKKGKALPNSAKLAFHEGDLNMSDWINPVLSRLVSEACLLTDGGHAVIDPIVDVRLISISAHGMQLRGVEYAAGAMQVAQEWWVRFQDPNLAN